MESKRQKPPRLFVPAEDVSRFKAANSGPVGIVLSDWAKRQFCHLGRLDRLKVLSALRLVRRGGYAALTQPEKLLARAEWGSPGLGYFLAEIGEVRLTFIGSASGNSLRLTNMTVIVADPYPDNDGELARADRFSADPQDDAETEPGPQSAFARARLAPCDRAASIETRRALADLAEACRFGAAPDDLDADVAERAVADAITGVRLPATSLAWRVLTRFPANDRDSRTGARTGL